MKTNAYKNSYSSYNPVTSYIEKIKKYPILPKETERKLFQRCADGDELAKQKLIESNLRLVVSVAKKYLKFIKNSEFFDIIQEGNEALIIAVEKFDLSFNYAFSTFAVTVIDNQLKNYVKRKDKIIRINGSLLKDRNRYKNLINSYEGQGKGKPSSREICQILNISANRLSEIIDSFKFEVVSLNKRVNSDEEDSIELGDTVKYSETGFSDIINKLSDSDILKCIKYYLEPVEYYVIYYRVLSKDKKVFMELGSTLGVSRTTIENIENRALKKLKTLLIDEELLCKCKRKLQLKEGDLYTKLKTTPLEPNNILLYYFTNSLLTNQEKLILKEILLGDYSFSIEELANYFEITVTDFINIYNNIKEKINFRLKDKKAYYEYKDFILGRYNTEIFNKDLTEFANYLFLKQEYFDASYEKIVNLFEDYESLPFSTKRIIKKFFQPIGYYNENQTQVDIEVNLNMFGYKKKDITIGIKKLKDTYQKNKDKFSLKEKIIIEKYIIHDKDGEFYSQSLILTCQELGKIKVKLLNRLERMYYNIDNINNNSLSKEKYLQIKENFSNEISSEVIKLLDLYYSGITISDIAAMYGLSSVKISQTIFDCKNNLLSLSNGRTRSNNLPKEKYIPYIMNPNCTFSNEMRNVLLECIIKNKDYDETAKNLNIPRKKVVKLMAAGIQKIDFYRFAIYKKSDVLPELKLDDSELEILIDDPHLPITELERNIVIFRYGLKGNGVHSISKLSELYNINSATLDSRIQAAMVNIHKYRIGEIKGKISYELDIVPNLKYFSKSDRIFLKELYQNSLSYNDIGKKYNLSKGQVSTILTRIQNYLFELLNNKNTPKFDFIYFDSIFDKTDLPFRGNIDLAVKIFNLYFGNYNMERLNLSEIKKELNLNSNIYELMELIHNLMVAVCKYKNGIRKEKSFTIKEINEYFNAHFEELSEYEQSIFNNFLNRYNEKTVACSIKIHKLIIYKLLCDKIKKSFSVCKSNKEEVLKILNNYKLNNSIRKSLMYSFRIRERELMNGKEKNHIYKILQQLNLQAQKEDTKKL